MTGSLDEALRWCEDARGRGKAISVGLVANCADMLPEMARRGVVPDVLTDQTSAHDPLKGYVPNGMTLEEALALRCADPDDYVKRSMEAMATHVRAMLALKRMGAVTFDYGNNLRAQAKLAGVENAFDIPGFVPEYIRPLFCEGTRAVPVGGAVGRGGRHLASRINWRWNCSRRTRCWNGGCGWRRSASVFRACRRAFAGWGMASGRSSARR